MPNIRGLILNLEGFQYDPSMELNMGYYNICLSEEASNLCNIILPWGKYNYKLLPIGVFNYLDILQEKTNKLLCGFEFTRAYIDNMLITTRGDCSYQLEKSELIMQKLKEDWIKCNIKKSFFGQTGMEYLVL